MQDVRDQMVSFRVNLFSHDLKLVPDSMSQPRAELFAAVLNTHTGEAVKISLGKHHQNSTKLTDSQIALHWISNSNKPLKQWVRNRVIEIRRFTIPEHWKYVHSKDMIADLGTRKGVKTEQVDQDSVWKNGFEWMKLESSHFPIKTVKKIELDKDGISTLKSEFIVYDTDNLFQLEWPSRNNNNGNFTYTAKECITTSILSEVLDIYQFSKYIIDPNKHRFKTVVRILALVYRFIAKLKEKLQNKAKGDIDNVNINTPSTSFTQVLSKHKIQRSENYFHQKATEEVKEFSKPGKYEKISSKKDKILYYTRQILPNQDIKHTGNPTDITLDLSSTSFFVPIIHTNSLIAYSIISDMHWYHKVAKHSDVETLMRYVSQKFYVIEGQSLMKQIRKRS